MPRQPARLRRAAPELLLELAAVLGKRLAAQMATRASIIFALVERLEPMLERLPGEALELGVDGGSDLAAHRPHLFLATLLGQRLLDEIDGLGRLAFNVKDELKRTWGRETRLQMHEKAAQKTAGAYPDITPQLTGKYAPAAR